MSTRQMRKLREQMRLAQLKDNPEPETPQEEFEPHFVATASSAYAGLATGVDSNEGEHSGKEVSVSSTDEVEVAVVQKKKNKNNKKKKNKKKRRDSASTNDSEEVDRAVAAVNELLGEPEPFKPDVVQKPNGNNLFKINYKYLNANEELTRKFGRDEDDGPKRRPQRAFIRPQRRQIVLSKERYNFKAKGMRMLPVNIVDGIRYYRLEHSFGYQTRLYPLVRSMKERFENYQNGQDWGYEILPPDTVEAVIGNLDIYFHYDEVTMGAETLESIIYFLQTKFLQSFSYLDGKCRLEYKYTENRVFHIILLKYVHILTNKACHRTALEVAKIMLNLDPSDPLGLIFFMDVLALRARVHEWLTELYELWAVERGAGCLFHMRYSYALALYHMYLKKRKEDILIKAGKFLTTAIMRYPNYLVLIMKYCTQENPTFMEHEMCTLADQTTSEDLKILMDLHARFVWPKWREQNVLMWVNKVAVEVVKGYNTDLECKNLILQKAKERVNVFRKNPLEIRRHLQVINSMSNLLLDGAMPSVEKTISFNPYPDKGTLADNIDEWAYYRGWGNGYEGDDVQSVFRMFFQSVIPERMENQEG